MPENIFLKKYIIMLRFFGCYIEATPYTDTPHRLIGQRSDSWGAESVIVAEGGAVAGMGGSRTWTGLLHGNRAGR
jgi:hypothetical protein